MSSGTRAADVKLQEIHCALIQGLQPFDQINGYDGSSHRREATPKVTDLQEGLQMVIDSFGFIGHESALLNMKRREAIKPEINH